MDYVKSSLSPEEARAHVRQDGRFVAVFAISVYDLACSSDDNSCEGLNEWVDDNVTYGLSDMNYTPVGILPAEGDEDAKVLIEVNAEYDADDFDDNLADEV